LALSEERPKSSVLEIEDVLQHYGEASRIDEVDIIRFTGEFNKLA